MRVRSLLVTALVGGALTVAAAPATAGPPVGGCGAAFQGPLTFAEIIEEFPPPPTLPDPEAALASFDSNGDDHLCVKPHPDGNRVIVVDNNAVGRSS